MKKNQNQAVYVRNNIPQVLYSVSHAHVGTMQNAKKYSRQTLHRNTNASNAKIGKE